MPTLLAYPHCVIDLERFQVRRGTDVLPLTPREVALLGYLAARAGEVVPRADVHEAVWGYHRDSPSQAVAVAIRRLRGKIEVDPTAPALLTTVPRVGWRFVGPAEVGSPSGLPQRYTPFVGREASVADTEAALGRARLVTVTGTGGIGKTRLAEEVARRALRRGTSVTFIDLREARTAEDAVRRVADALRVPSDRDDAVDAALARLGDALVVLDNLEQIEGRLAGVLQRWLSETAVRILTTSRVATEVDGEQSIRLGPLDLEPALELFTHGALAAFPGFHLDDRSRPVALDILDRVDRLSLAIELAAARLSVLDLVQLRAQLDRRFRLLRDPDAAPDHRHGALQTTLQWSLDLLSSDERAVFAQLGAFRGGFLLADAEAVVESDAWLVDALQTLVRASLVERHGARFSMLESVRLLAAAASDAAVQSRHWAHYCALPVERVVDELDNVRIATERATAAGDPVAAAGFAALGRLLLGRGSLATVIELGEPLLALDLPDEAVWSTAGILATAHAQSGDRARALVLLDDALDTATGVAEADLLAQRGDLHRERGEPDRALRDLERALARREALGDPIATAGTQGRLGLLVREQGQMDRAFALFDAALGTLESADAPGEEGMARLHRGIAYKERGRLSDARRDLDRALERFRVAGDRRYEAVVLQELGVLARNEGRSDEAVKYLTEALEHHREMGLLRNVAMVLGNLANLHADAGRYPAALAAYQESLAVKDGIGETVFRCVTLGNMGEVYLLSGDLESALEVLEAAITGARDTRFRAAEAAFSGTLGEVRLRLGDDAGWADLDHAENLLAELGQTQERIKCIGRRGRMAVRDGQVERALVELERARGLLEEAGLGASTPAGRDFARLQAALDDARA